MQPKYTDAQAARRKEALQGAVSATVFRLLMAAVLVWLRMGMPLEGIASKVLLIVLVLELGSILPVWINFKTRLKEIEGGEEDAAAQY